MSAAPRTLRFGHSPDADDAYMFYGFHTGLAAVEGCRVEHVLEDIQSLNRRALERADLEITAVSAHAYTFLAERYAVLACGASMGHGVGPVVVAREPRTLAVAARAGASPSPARSPRRRCCCAASARIACPWTSCSTASPPRSLAGEVEAGVIIHESQLTYREEGLVKVLDFGELWQERDGLPVPLGLDVVRRDLGPELMRAVSAGFRASIQAALDHEDEAIAYALQFGRGLDTGQGRKFVHMYVNDLTLDMGERDDARWRGSTSARRRPARSSGRRRSKSTERRDLPRPSRPPRPSAPAGEAPRGAP